MVTLQCFLQTHSYSDILRAHAIFWQYMFCFLEVLRLLRPKLVTISHVYVAHSCLKDVLGSPRYDKKHVIILQVKAPGIFQSFYLSKNCVLAKMY